MNNILIIYRDTELGMLHNLNPEKVHLITNFRNWEILYNILPFCKIKHGFVFN